jgi:rRNA maturation endonuclease Nob1
MEPIFTCLRCETVYETRHLPQPVTECPVCGWRRPEDRSPTERYLDATQGE